MQRVFTLIIGDPKNLWKRYVVALCLILTTVFIGHSVHVSAIRQMESDAETINLSGRQRMLSQRILFQANAVRRGGNPSDILALSDSLDLFEESHKKLISMPDLPESLNDLYHSDPRFGLDGKVKRYIELGRSVTNEPRRNPRLDLALNSLEELGRRELLLKLDKAVKLFEDAANEKQDFLYYLQNIALASVILTLIIEGALIFIPAQRAVSQNLKGLEEANNALSVKTAELKQLSEKLAFEANHDPLTGLANRAKLMRELHTRMARYKEDGGVLCVMHLDLDRFKEVNDTLGHAVGDALLIEAAERMRINTRNGDLVARVGGDEFVVLCNFRKTDMPKDTQIFADAMIEAISQPFEIDGNTCEVGMSIGFAFANTDCKKPEQIIANSDVALYAAKNAGRGVAYAYDTVMRENLKLRQALMDDLDRAAGTDEFRPFFQPQIGLETGAITGFEALARWYHPERGIISPVDFIETAEETGMVASIDDRICQASLIALSKMRGMGFYTPRVSINVSSRTLRRKTYAFELANALELRGLAPSDIAIEVDANLFATKPDKEIVETIAHLKRHEIPVHVGGFGGSPIILSEFAKLGVTGIKLDRELVAGLHQDPTMLPFAEAIVGMASGLGLDTFAEGVETELQFNTLRAAGFVHAQGYGIASPMTQDALEDWITTYTGELFSEESRVA